MDKLIDEVAFKEAESIYLDSPDLDGPCCYDPEYFRKAIEAYINYSNKPTDDKRIPLEGYLKPDGTCVVTKYSTRPIVRCDHCGAVHRPDMPGLTPCPKDQPTKTS